MQLAPWLGGIVCRRCLVTTEGKKAFCENFAKWLSRFCVRFEQKSWALDAFCFFNKLIKHDLNTFVSGRKQHVKQMLHIEQLGFEV